MKSYSPIVRATAGAVCGLFCVIGATSAWAVGSAVINEFHYNSDDNSSPEEFVELHNPGDAPYDLTGHALADAITYAFPAGTSIPAGGYLVIAQNPATITSKFGVATVLGPWSGNLSSGGEEIELRNAANAKVDSVDYKAGFPWPTRADGGGATAELIHPALDNNLGSHWRSAGTSVIAPTPLIATAAQQWKYFKGTAEPAADWRAEAFDDSSWLSGQAPLGYGPYANNTGIVDMRDNYTSVYFRRSFTVAAGNVPNTLTLRMFVDDGCIVTINGVEAARFHVPAGALAYNSLAINHNASWETVTLANTASYLHEGTNVMAIHTLNSSLSSSDLSLDLSLTPVSNSAKTATPGEANSTLMASNQAPPVITSVAHTPQQPTSGQAVTLTARIQDSDGMGAVSLAYQLVNPGSYIRITDATYASTWTTVAMVDDGTQGDVTSGDGIYTVVLPGTLQTHRRLVRYKVTMADALSNTQTVPYADDETPNFAYFVYDGVPAWSGAMRPTAFNGFPATAVENHDTSVMRSMNDIQLIANSTDVDNCQYNSSFQETRFRGTLIQKGVVYDHVEYRIRGIGSTYQSGKNKWKIHFNRSRDFQAYDNYGRPYAETWNELPINSNASPWAPLHRGSAGVEEASSHRLFQLAGMAALNTQYFQFRVIDGASENGTTQYNGDLWGLYMGFEPTEGNFLDERGLPDGNLYSIEGNGGDLDRQGLNQVTDGSDWTAFRSSVESSGQTEAWYRANVDLDSLYTFMAINRLIGNVDLRPGDNYRFYRNPQTSKWVIIPYDLDMMYIAAHHWGGTMDGVVVAGAPNVFRAIMRHPNIAREYRNRCRELLSLVASDGTSGGGQIGQLIAEYASFVNPIGQAKTWADIDAAMWNLHPQTKGNGGNTGQSNHKGNFFRATFFDARGGNGGTVSTSSWIRSLVDGDSDGFSDHEGLMQWFVNFSTNTWPAGSWSRRAITGFGGGTDSDPNRQLGYGYKYLEFEGLYGGWGNANVNPTAANLFNDFPNKPTLTSNNPAFTTNDLRFTPSAFADPQGAGTHAATQWRIARISAPGIPGYVTGEPWKYELENGWTSPEIAPSADAFAFPLGVAEVGKRYRARVRHKDSSGNWSYWSNPVTFDAVAPPPYTLIHYWNFNSSNLTPAKTLLGGIESTSGTIAYASAESFAALNARNADVAGVHQRINNPLTAGTFVRFDVPTTGFKDVLIQYEARRSGSGAGTQIVDYTPDGGTTWLNHATLTINDVSAAAQVPVYPLDFSGIAIAANNPRFGIRITFQQGLGGTVGNNRIDNFTVEGRPIHPNFATWRAQYFTTEELADSALSGPAADPTSSGIKNLMRYALGLARNAPLTAAAGNSLLPKVQDINGQKSFRFRYNPAATDLVWEVQAGPAPGNWTHVLLNSSTTPPLVSDGWATVPLPASLSGEGTDVAMFVRLQVSTP